MNTYPKSQVNITVDSRVYIGLQKLARTAGMTTTGYATQLFSAAYTARHKPTGDRELDEAVAQMSAPAPPVDKTSAKEIAQLQAQVSDLRAKLTEMAKKPVTSQQSPAPADEALKAEIRSLSDRLATAASHELQLSTACDEIKRLRAELEDRPAPIVIPDTALGRFLHTWNAELRTAA
ncbi:hypothetical protein [Labrys neptuniae]|uniref:KfrA N-terminal DNA-binding domain-containing protein n=1 Tax=Labrys neptuniae TaxID=376174 RepID=A0ABV3PFV7_9HYPH